MHMDDLKGLTYDELVFSTLLGKVRAATIESGDDGWRADPRVHQNVEALRRQFTALEPVVLSKRIAGITERAQAYRRQLKAIQDGLDEPEVSAFASCVERGRGPPPLARQAAPVSAAAPTTPPRTVSRAAALQAMRTPVTRKLYAEHLGQDAANQLAADETVQEALTDDLVAMAAQLRKAAEAQSDALHSRDAVLESAAAGLLKSSDAVARRVKDTRTAVRRSSRSIFFQLFLFLTVAGVFVGTYSFISVTSVAKFFVPYRSMATSWTSRREQQRAQRARRPQAAAAPPLKPDAAPDVSVAPVVTPSAASHGEEQLESSDWDGVKNAGDSDDASDADSEAESAATQIGAYMLDDGAGAAEQYETQMSDVESTAEYGTRVHAPEDGAGEDTEAEAPRTSDVSPEDGAIGVSVVDDVIRIAARGEPRDDELPAGPAAERWPDDAGAASEAVATAASEALKNVLDEEAPGPLDVPDEEALHDGVIDRPGTRADSVVEQGQAAEAGDEMGEHALTEAAAISDGQGGGHMAADTELGSEAKAVQSTPDGHGSRFEAHDVAEAEPLPGMDSLEREAEVGSEVPPVNLPTLGKLDIAAAESDSDSEGVPSGARDADRVAPTDESRAAERDPDRAVASHGIDDEAGFPASSDHDEDEAGAFVARHADAASLDAPGVEADSEADVSADTAAVIRESPRRDHAPEVLSHENERHSLGGASADEVGAVADEWSSAPRTHDPRAEETQAERAPEPEVPLADDASAAAESSADAVAASRTREALSDTLSAASDDFRLPADAAAAAGFPERAHGAVPSGEANDAQPADASGRACDSDLCQVSETDTLDEMASGEQQAGDDRDEL